MASERTHRMAQSINSLSEKEEKLMRYLIECAKKIGIEILDYKKFAGLRERRFLPRREIVERYSVSGEKECLAYHALLLDFRDLAIAVVEKGGIKAMQKFFDDSLCIVRIQDHRSSTPDKIKPTIYFSHKYVEEAAARLGFTNKERIPRFTRERKEAKVSPVLDSLGVRNAQYRVKFIAQFAKHQKGEDDEVRIEERVVADYAITLAIHNNWFFFRPKQCQENRLYDLRNMIISEAKNRCGDNPKEIMAYIATFGVHFIPNSSGNITMCMDNDSPCYERFHNFATSSEDQDMGNRRRELFGDIFPYSSTLTSQDLRRDLMTNELYRYLIEGYKERLLKATEADPQLEIVMQRQRAPSNLDGIRSLEKALRQTVIPEDSEKSGERGR